MKVVKVEYYCDFCKTKMDGEGHTIDDTKSICKNCYDHLVNQSWRYNTDSIEYLKLVKERDDIERSRTSIIDYQLHRDLKISEELDEIGKVCHFMYRTSEIETIEHHRKQILDILKT